MHNVFLVYGEKFKLVSLARQISMLRDTLRLKWCSVIGRPVIELGGRELAWHHIQLGYLCDRCLDENDDDGETRRSFF